MFMPIAADPFMMNQVHHHHSRYQSAMPLLPLFDPAQELEDMAGAGLFAIGFANAFAATNGLTEVQACMTGLKSEESALKDIIADFKAGSIDKLIDGAKKLIAVLNNAPTDLKNCENISGDITKITAWGEKIFSSPAAIVENVIKNSGDIMKEVPLTMSDFNSGAYEQSGADADKIVTDIFGTVNSSFESDLDLSLMF